jgi:AmmeMemoRadiSam system protein B
MSSPLDCPRLRPGLAAAPEDGNPDAIVIWDQRRFSPRAERFNYLEFLWLQLFDGQRTLRDIQMEAMRQLGGQLLPIEVLACLVEKLDEALFLDGPTFRAQLARSPVREPSCIGCYEADRGALPQQLRGLFTGPRGPGLPGAPRPDGRLCAALLPHIDYHRGGATFAWGFKEVFERTDASLFVIIGTSHYSGHRFTLTRKDFRTPLGIAPTDQAYIDRLVAHYGAGLFDDEVAHWPEHSIELEVVFLQYLYENQRPFRIVPLVVGPFQDCVMTGLPPSTRTDIRRMVEALRRVEQETPEPICYLISGDLAHIGPKFGDPEPVSLTFLSHSKERDQAILRQAEAADPDGYFGAIAEEGDRRRICGLPPTYTVLDALRPRGGRVLHYDQYVHPRGFESVSFASVAFYR